MKTCSVGTGQPESHDNFEHLKFFSRMSFFKTYFCMCILMCSILCSINVIEIIIFSKKEIKTTIFSSNGIE